MTSNSVQNSNSTSSFCLSEHTIPPSTTLYISNLNTSISRNDLLNNIFEFFTPFGDIFGIVHQKGFNNRGQVFLTFKEITSATSALRVLQNKMFLGKKIKINFAKSKSKVLLMSDENYKTWKLEYIKSLEGNKSQQGAVLLVQNLPENITNEALRILFMQFPGFIESRLIDSKLVAFIEFQKEEQADIAFQALENFKVTSTHTLSISWAKMDDLQILQK